MKYSSSLALAHAVLNCIESKWEDTNDIIISSYSNGREQGLHLANYKTPSSSPSVSFSQDRNSDSIIIYCGNFINFNMQGNVPDDRTYNNAKKFDCNQVYEAADFIYNYLTKE